MGDSSPRVSVLTAVHNGERYLDATIASIVEQSYTDFEYILIDDASSDGSAAILAAWAGRDSRIRLLHNPSALNPAGALNRALAEARGDYIAILDHDDLSYPTRLAEQVAYLDGNPTVGVVGSQAMGIDEAGKERKPMNFPTNPVLARWRIFFHTPVLHSSAMMRRSLVEQVGPYSVLMWAATDYELMARLSQVAEINNLPTTLVAYRRSPQQVSSTKNRIQTGQVLLFLQSLVLARFGFDKRRLPAITALYYGTRNIELSGEESVLEAGAFLGELYEAFVEKIAMPDDEREIITQDCAWYYLQLAWVHRRLFRAAGRQLLTRAKTLDPLLWRRPHTWQRLRHLYRRARKPVQAETEPVSL